MTVVVVCFVVSVTLAQRAGRRAVLFLAVCLAVASSSKAVGSVGGRVARARSVACGVDVLVSAVGQ